MFIVRLMYVRVHVHVHMAYKCVYMVGDGDPLSLICVPCRCHPNTLIQSMNIRICQIHGPEHFDARYFLGNSFISRG